MKFPPANPLRQLLKPTPRGSLIHHPLITQPPPPALPAMPPDHITSRELAGYSGASERHVRQLCSHLPVVKFGRLRHNAYPRALALQCVERTRKNRQYTQPPPGYLSRAETLQILHLSSAALSRMKNLRPITCLSPRSRNLVYYYAPEAVETALLDLERKRKATAQHLLSLIESPCTTLPKP